MPVTVFEGTWEEIERHKAELKGYWLRVTVQPEKPQQARTDAKKRPSALGKYAFVAGGSEEFAREKQVEIEREDRTIK